MNLNVGDEFTVKYPFRINMDSNAMSDWIPGCRSEQIYPDDGGLFADGIGEMKLTVVDTYKPGKYMARVFYTRSWVDPEGEEFGSRRLMVCTVRLFKERAREYGYPYQLSTDKKRAG